METSQDQFFFGIHFMVDAYNSPISILSDHVELKNALKEIPKSLGMHTISDAVIVEVGPNNHKDPGGLSGMVLIAESHFSFHTFPARGFVTIDVYTCKDELDTNMLLSKLKEIFQFQEYETHYIERGRNYPQQNLQ